MSHHPATGPYSGLDTKLSVALVSGRQGKSTHLCGVKARQVREPRDIRPSDDVVLFHGSDMAHELSRFLTGAENELPPVMMLAPRLDWNDVVQALGHGATSYLLENQFTCLFTEALLLTSRGVRILDPMITAQQIWIPFPAPRAGRSTDKAAAAKRLQQLSQREQQVMELLTAGTGIRDIACELHLTEKTVRNYLTRIYEKLGVRCRSEAILCWLGHLDPRGGGAAG